MKLVTSNKRKLEEFRRFGLLKLEMTQGPDIKEVQGDSIETILYKSFDNGPDTICEDTSLLPENGVGLGVNIRWEMDKLNDYAGQRAVWQVLLGVNTGDKVEIYRGAISGVIRHVDRMPVDCFGFDAHFVPDGCEFSLHELDTLGKKDNVSARRRAVEAMMTNRPHRVYAVDKIKPWEGEYQNEGIS